MFFPVVVHAMDILVSSVGILFVTAAAHSTSNPMDQLTRGYRWVHITHPVHVFRASGKVHFGT